MYEARSSGDVDFFLAHNPEENGALMFYDPNQEKSDQKATDNINAIISIFKNIGEEGRSEEDWVNQLNDKIHLMRIDATLEDNARTVQEYKISSTPILILLDYGKIMFMEQLSDKSFDHVKDLLMSQLEQKKKAAAQKEEAKKQTEKAATSQNSASGSYEGQNQELAAAHKAAEDALKALEDLRKTFEQHLAVEKAQKDAEEAKKKADEAQKKLEQATKSLDQSKKDGSQQKNGSQQQQNVQIQYIPVYSSRQPATQTTSTRVTYPSSYWSVVDSGRR